MLSENIIPLEQLIAALDAHAIVSIADAQGNITYINNKFLQISQYSRKELMGNNHRMLKSGLHSPGFFEEMWQKISSGNIWHGEICNRKKDGSYYWVNSTIYPLLDENELPTAYISIRTDITDRMQFSEAIQDNNVKLRLAQERAEAASHAKSIFLSNMSHEIRTPLSCVIGLSQLALMDAKESKETEYFKQILASGNHLLGIINSILDLSRIEAGKLAIESRTFSFSQITESLDKMMQHQAKSKNLELEFEISPSLPVILQGDPMRLSQLLVNYTGNAIKFSNRGKITVRVFVVDEDQYQCTIRCEVTDSGIGIAPQDLPKLFQPFEQLDNSSTRQNGGSGLGLSICKSLVQLMHGEVGVTSEPNIGSTFWFTARLGKADWQQASFQAEVTPSKEDIRSLSGARILIAEDNLFNQAVLKECLLKNGAHIVVVNNGQEAIAALQRNSFDCILMDMQMPVMNGIEATLNIRMLPGQDKIPIIAITASANAEVQDACLKAGMNDFISKPIVLNKLYTTLGKWLHDIPGCSFELPAKNANADKVKQSCFDLCKLSNMLGNNQELTRKHALHFLQTSEACIHEMESAVKNNDLKTLKSLAHRSYSSACMVGAIEFAGLCQSLEFLEPDSDILVARKLVEYLKISLGLIGTEIERLCIQ